MIKQIEYSPVLLSENAFEAVTSTSSNIRLENLDASNADSDAGQDIITVDLHSEMDEATGSPAEQEDKESGPGLVLFNFTGSEPAWITVNDTVMGGISSSLVAIDPQQQRLTFSGDVSLENNGGFASTRSQWVPYNLDGFDGIAMRVRGDGNLYRLRIRTQATGADIAYTALFATEKGKWQEVYIPFSEMVPLFRGYVVSSAGPIDPSTIRSFGLMLADKQQGDFSLEVDWINAVAEKSN